MSNSLVSEHSEYMLGFALDELNLHGFDGLGGRKKRRRGHLGLYPTYA
ncbi:MAG: hypothetical protein GY866_08620 [Proteobacteria bacterium]|nr:hypothetical protein [Pseudomonadota bacterium]